MCLFDNIIEVEKLYFIYLLSEQNKKSNLLSSTVTKLKDITDVLNWMLLFKIIKHIKVMLFKKTDDCNYYYYYYY